MYGTLPLNVLQSVELNLPVFAAEATGRLKVCVAVVLEILKSVPLVPVAKYCTCAVNPFNAVIPVEKVVITWHKWESCVCTVVVFPPLFVE